MGKKTEEKISVIKTALLKWKSLGENATAGEGKLKDALANREAIDKKNDQYYKSKGWDGNKPGREQEMDTDKVYQKLQKDWEDAYTKVNQLQKIIVSLKTDLKNARGIVERCLADFETFVNEKDKNKDATKKKSVPAARVFIKEVRGALA